MDPAAACENNVKFKKKIFFYFFVFSAARGPAVASHHLVNTLVPAVNFLLTNDLRYLENFSNRKKLQLVKTLYVSIILFLFDV